MLANIKKLFLFILLLIPLNIYAIEYPKLNAKNVVIYDLTDNKSLYEMDSNSKISIASLTKIATTITAIENIDNLNEKVTITNKILYTVAPEASKAGLKAGDNLTYLDLLYASMLPSGADATNSLAILSSGSIDAFVDKMNDLAKRIGLSNTHFVNVTGLDEEDHYSTANDVIKLLSYSLKNDTFKKIFTTKEYTLSNGLTVRTTLNKYNKSLNLDLSGIKGSKTGFTLDAGYCMVSLIESSTKDVIILVLNDPYEEGISYHIIDTYDLMSFINNNYHNQKLYSKNDELKSINVILSNKKDYKILSNEDIYSFLPDDYDKEKVVVEYTGKNKISFLDKKGSKLGEVKVLYDGAVVSSNDVYLNNSFMISPILLLIIIMLLFIMLKPRKKRRRRR